MRRTTRNRVPPTNPSGGLLQPQDAAQAAQLLHTLNATRAAWEAVEAIAAARAMSLQLEAADIRARLRAIERHP